MRGGRGILALLGLLLGLAAVCGTPPSVTASGAEAPEALTLQSVDSSEFPKVVLRVVLPPEMLAGGDLGSRDFTLTENGARIGKLVARRVETRREPVQVVMAIDVSGSMRGEAIENAKAAARAFVDAMAAGNRIAIVTFSDEAVVVSGFTGDKAALGASIDRLSAAHETALYDALVVSSSLFTGVDGDKAIVLLSDGGDTMSAAGIDGAANAVAAAGAPVYAVALQGSEYNPSALDSITRLSRGRLVAAGDPAQLSALFGEIATQIQSPYEVAYTSLQPPTKEIEIDLVVDSRDLRAAVGTAIANPRYSASAAAPAKAAPLPAAGWILAIAALAFAGAALLAGGIAWLLERDPSTLGQLAYYEQLHESAPAPMGMDEADPSSARGRLLAVAGSVAAKGGFEAAIRRELERAGLPLRPVEYMTLHVALVLVAGTLVQFLAGQLLLTVLAVIVFALAPVVLLAFLARRRLEAFEAQLPDVLNLLGSSLRAGWGLLQAIGIVVSEIGPPAGPEFARVMTEARLGLSLEEALDKMAQRLGSDNFSWAVVAISIQREVGGNLAQVLDNVAATVRERDSIRRQVKALTAEGRLSGIILVALPIVEAIIIYVMNPGYMTMLLSSTVGVISAAAAVVLLIVGAFWLRSIAKIEV